MSMLSRFRPAIQSRLWTPTTSLSPCRLRPVYVNRGKHTARSSTNRKDNVSETDTVQSLPPQLALRPLRDIALLCGRNSTGTKSVLRADLETILEDEDGARDPATRTKTDASPLRILSIDMGVRNLAYCLLHVDRSGGNTGVSVPRLAAWERLSLIGGEKQRSSRMESRRQPLEGEEETPALKKASASAFSPPAMAAVAARLVRDRLLPLAPSHVLIERQRFRSGGGAAVLEWTVRVNSLEAMLHGVLAYRQLDGLARGDSNSVRTIQAVSPQRVSQFLLRGGVAGSEAELLAPRPRKASKEKDIKDVKEAFVARVLRREGDQEARNPLLTYDTSVQDMVHAYLLRWDAKQKRKRPSTETKEKATTSDTTEPAPLALSKIDDLADCVAQGLIWLEWERNKAILRREGAEALLAQKQLPG